MYEDQSQTTSSEIRHKIATVRSALVLPEYKKRSGFKAYNVVIMVVSDLIAGLFVGAGIGYIFYKYFNAHLIVMGIFILLGGIAGFVNLYKSLIFLEKEGSDA